MRLVVIAYRVYIKAGEHQLSAQFKKHLRLVIPVV